MLRDKRRTSAIEQLELFGLSSYAAETFVTLVALGGGTAKEVSDGSAVPRTRVYDAVDELQERDLVDVDYSSPRVFHPLPVETVRRQFVTQFQEHIDRLTDALAELEPAHQGRIQHGIWTIQGTEAVTERVIELFDSAQEELVYATVADALTEKILDRLDAAVSRGVSVQTAGASSDVRDRLARHVDDVRPFTPGGAVPKRRACRIVLVDRQHVLVSVVGGHDSGSGPTETAVWTTGSSNTLVMVLQTMVAAEGLGHPEHAT